MAKYSIHRCLSELKILDKRIIKTISQNKFMGFKKNSAKGEYTSNLIIEDFEKECKTNLESAKALIKRRNKIKQAVVNSNANTHIEIGGVDYTVASAIERKESIKYEKLLLEILTNQYNDVLARVKEANDKVEIQLEQKINVMLGAENSAKNSEMVQAFSKTYREDNGYVVIDPLNLKKMIDELDERITSFESEVDYKLSTSNAITEVEIED